MANGDIAAQTLSVGNALTSVKLDEMIVKLALGIAKGQYLLDSEGVEITKLMGLPGTVSIGNEKLSMLEAGFLPSFYQFVDTILEMKIEVNIRSETSSTKKVTEKNSGSVSVSGKAGWGWGSVEASATAAYSKTIDSTHTQKYSQEMSAQSLMRTKLVAVPAPEVLVERIRMLLDNVRQQSESGTTDDAAMEDYFAALEPATANGTGTA